MTSPLTGLRSRIGQTSLATLGLAVLLSAIPLIHAQQPSPPPRNAPAKVVLKLDDLVGLHPNWQKVVDSVNRRGIKASFGIICNSLEHPSPQYLQWIKDVQAGGRIEFWCHGYDHKQWTENGLALMEFSGPPLEQQKQHLARCQELAIEHLGAPFKSFGAPFNATDPAFAQVIRDSPDFKVWIYGDAQYPMGKTVLIRVGDTNIENPIFHPSAERFIQGYRKHAAQPYFVIQGHPPQWDAERLAEFEKILDFLTQEKAVFMTPTELACHAPAPGPAGPLPPPSKPVSTAAVPAAGVPIGANLLANGDFAKGMEDWKLERMQNAAADARVENIDGQQAIHISVPQKAEKRFFVQWDEVGSFPVADGKTYTLSFRARARPDAEIVVVLPTAHGPGEELARQDHIQLTADWKTYNFTLTPKHGADAAHLVISGLAGQAADYWFANLSMKQNQ